MSRQSMHRNIGVLNITSISLSLVFLSSLVKAFAASANSDDHFIVPSFSLLELRSNRRGDELASVLSTTGIIAVTGIDDASSTSGAFAENREKAFGGLCRCMATKNDEFINVVDNTDRSLLSDGITTRTSIATATIRNTPLSLPKDQIEHFCGNQVPEAMETLRDYVSVVTDAFLGSLDHLIHQSFSLQHMSNSCSGKKKKNSFLLRTLDGAEFSSMKAIVDASQNLEHFHLYSKPSMLSSSDNFSTISVSSSSENMALSTHVDAGLFLSFIPAYSCHDDSVNNIDLSFQVNVDGETKAAVFPPDSVILMLGAGAEHWLQLPSLLPLRATKHAVKMRDGNVRAWYGMMNLVPNDAIIQEYPKPSTFADMRHLVSVSSAKRSFRDTNPLANDDLTIGCGIYDLKRAEQESALASHFVGEGISSVIPPRRRLSMVPDASFCNNSTNFYCWMTCLDIPNYQNAAQEVKEGKSLYCLDPSTLFTYGGEVAKAVLPCDDPETGVPGKAMNTNCIGSWQPTAPDVPAQVVVINSTQPSGSQPFCYGATSMYMEGFQWRGVVCVVYLFPVWVITSTGKLIAACVGTLMLSVFLEGIIFARRSLARRFPSISIRILVSTFLYGCQLTLAYFIMLVIMTYSVPLFVSVILGLMLGHLAFSIVGKEDKLGDEGASPCCMSDVVPLENDLSDKRKDGTRETYSINEGGEVTYKTFSTTAEHSFPSCEQLTLGEEKTCCCDTDIESS